MPEPTDAELAAYAAGNTALANFRRAQADLYDHTAREVAAGISEETPEYERLNKAVIDAGKRLPKDIRHLRKGI